MRRREKAIMRDIERWIKRQKILENTDKNKTKNEWEEKGNGGIKKIVICWGKLNTKTDNDG